MIRIRAVTLGLGPFSTGHRSLQRIAVSICHLCLTFDRGTDEYSNDFDTRSLSRRWNALVRIRCLREFETLTPIDGPIEALRALCLPINQRIEAFNDRRIKYGLDRVGFASVLFDVQHRMGEIAGSRSTFRQ